MKIFYLLPLLFSAASVFSADRTSDSLAMKSIDSIVIHNGNMYGQDYTSKALESWPWLGIKDDRIYRMDLDNIQSIKGVGSIPSRIANLTGLRELYISSTDCKGTNILPEEIVTLPLKTLNVNTPLIPMQSLIGKLSTLELLSMNVRSTNTKTLDTCLNSLPQLTELHLNNSGLTSVPQSLHTLKSLKRLFLRNNNFGFDEIAEISAIVKETGIEQSYYSGQMPRNYDSSREWRIENPGDSILLTLSVSGKNNQYQWLWAKAPIATTTTGELLVKKSGSYECIVTNASLPTDTIRAKFNVVVGSEQDSTILSELNYYCFYDTLWNTKLPISQWRGVTVEHERVVGVDISGAKFMWQHALQRFAYISKLRRVNADRCNMFFSTINFLKALHLDTLTYTNQTSLETNHSETATVVLARNPLDSLILKYYPDEVFNLPNDSSSNTFTWFKDGKKIAVDSTCYGIKITKPGSYWCEVKDKNITDLVLNSDTIRFVSLSPREYDSLALCELAKNIIDTSFKIDTTKPINTWNGVTVKSGRVVGIDWSGHTLARQNDIYLPDGSCGLPKLTSLNVSNCGLTINGVLAYSKLSHGSFSYIPQNIVLDYFSDTLWITPGDTGIDLTAKSSRSGNHFKWLRNGSEFSAKDSSVLRVTEGGNYHCFISNDALPGLSIPTDTMPVLFIDTAAARLDSLALVELIHNCVHSPVGEPGGTWANLIDYRAPMRTWGKWVTVRGGRIRELWLDNSSVFGEVPASIGNLTECRALSLGGYRNKVTSLPPTIKNLTLLETLLLSQSDLRAENLSLETFKNLRELDLTNTSMTEIPESIRSLKNLSVLKISNNKLSTLPVWIGEFAKLDTFMCGSNPFETLPLESYRAFGSSTNLDLSKSKLKTLPITYSALAQLTSINLENAQLCVIPDWFYDLPNLTLLNISNNLLTSVNKQRTFAVDSMKICVDNNMLHFDDLLVLKKNLIQWNLRQSLLGEPLEYTLDAGESVALDFTTRGEGNQYFLYQLGVRTDSATERSTATVSLPGVYRCMVTNPQFPNVQLWWNFVTIKAATAITNVSTFHQESNDLEIYPCPVSYEDNEVFFQLPSKSGLMRLCIYDALGHRIDMQTEFVLSGSTFRWDLRDDRGEKVGPGAYLGVLDFVRADGKRVLLKKMFGVKR